MKYILYTIFNFSFILNYISKYEILWNINKYKVHYYFKKPELITIPSMIHDGEDITIIWKNIKFIKTLNDYILLSCGPTNGMEDYLEKVNINTNNMKSIKFINLPMLRCNYVISYIQNSKILVERMIPMANGFNIPKQGHISFTNNTNEMVIMYNTNSNITIPSVEYGLNRNLLHLKEIGTSTTYSSYNMCHEPATIISQQYFQNPGYMHKIILKNLKLKTNYYYRFGNDNDGWSKIYQFISRPNQKDKSITKFIAYADMGIDGGYAALQTAKRVNKEVVENGYNAFLLHFGDISYARGKGHIWDRFFGLIEPYATMTPYMVSIGNHEYDYISGGENDPSNSSDEKNGFHPIWGNYGNDSGGECSVPMYHRFHSPSNGNGIYWYSFDYGSSIHVIQLSSEHNYTRGSKQYEWLRNDLKNVDRNNTDFIVVTLHRMMYTTQLGEEKDYIVAGHLRQELEELLFQYKVNVVMVGHQHSYERSCPVYKENCMEKAPVHITVGSAGAALERQGFSPSLGNWSLVHTNQFGYLRVKIANKKMNIQFIENENGTIFDELEIKPYH